MRLRMSIDNKPDANLTAYLVDYGPPGATAEPFVVTRGWMDPQNRPRPDRTQPVTQGRLATYRWVLQPKDYVFAAGHRIGVVVFSSDQEHTLLPLGGTRLTVDRGPAGSPSRVVGGTCALT
jgi:X-Pro dipeptidyl-peptidase